MKEANGRATSVLARRPHGAIQDSDFKFVETDVPAPGAGEVLVRNLMLSSDPAQRAWIALKPSHGHRVFALACPTSLAAHP